MMTVKELKRRLAHVEDDALVNVTIDRNPDGMVALDAKVVDTLDDGDVFDMFIEVSDEDWKRGF